MRHDYKVDALNRAKQLADDVEETIKLLNVSFSGDALSFSTMFVTINGKSYSLAKIVEASFAQRPEVLNFRELVAEFEEMIVNDSVTKTRGNQALASRKMKCGRFMTRKVLKRRKERARAIKKDIN